MHEFVEMMRSTLDACGEITEIILNGLSLLCIAAGIILSVIRGIENRRKYPSGHPLHTYLRMVFGGWLVVALELQLAADIVGTMISPTTAHLIELGAIAVIRTFLNYFLNKELLEERELSRAGVKE